MQAHRVLGENMKVIAVIDDDVHIGDILEAALRKNGYEVIRAYSGSEAVYMLKSHRPDLILLDLMLPGIMGDELIRQISGIPVIVVSARAATEDKVKLLMSGAVDYVTKPFELKELMARISVHLRREGAGKGSSLLSTGELTLDTGSRQCFAGGKEIKLTRTEYAILKLLMENKGRAVSKAAILEDISRDTPDCTETSLKIHVSNLRKKFRQAGTADYIQSVWGIGFKITEIQS